jgi:thiosulfate/3-mercaptopyruvate sulfurtransferase
MPARPDGVSPLISADELREAVSGAGAEGVPGGAGARSAAPVILDVRSGAGGKPDYLAGHIPSAVYVDLVTDLSGNRRPGGHEGRSPLPDPGVLENLMRGWGIGTGRPAVVYDDVGGFSAARAWWLLRWAGHAPVRVLDGGLGAWVAAGGSLTTAITVPERGDVVARPGSLPAWSADDVAALPAGGVLIDARPAERYRGESEPLDAVAGHIPGAINLPTADNLAPDGRFLPEAELRARFDAHGLRGREPLIVYCGSGITAAHELLALNAAGLDGILYPPSWSGWISDPTRPVATS